MYGILVVFASFVILARLTQIWWQKYSWKIIRFFKMILMDFETMDSLAEHDVVQYGIFDFRFALVNNPRLIQKVLSSDVCLDKPRLVYKLLGTKYSLVSEPHVQWRIDRRYFSSCFNNSMLQTFIPLFSSAADRLVKEISEKHSDGCPFNVHHYLEKCVVELVCAATFDVHLAELGAEGENMTKKIIETTNMSSSIFLNRMKNLFLIFDKIFHLTSTYKKDNENRNFIFQSLLDFVAAGNIGEPDDFKKNIFLYKLLRLKDRLTKEHLKDHVLAIGAAAFDALATSSAYCVLFLAMNPEIQQKVYKEIEDAFHSIDESNMLERLSKLDYLGRVIKESMRLVPGVHGIARQTTDDFDLSDSCKLSEGTIIILNIFKLHRRKDLWGDDAECFNPDRFLQANIEQRNQFFIPFSAGKRNCIGERYATAAFKIMILKLVKSFEFSTSLKLDELKFKRQIAVKLLNGHMVSVKRRNHLNN